MTDTIVVYCTTPGSEISEKISNYLVSEKLAACCNILPGIKSVYSWKGAVETAMEELLIIKTTVEKFQLVEQAVKTLHPYDVPEIIFLNIEGGNTEYLEWVSQNTRVSHGR